VTAVRGNTWNAPRERGPDALGLLLARFDARRTGRERPISSPWENLNTIVGGGVWPGLHVIVGGTGSGKSQWAMQLSLTAARAGTPVLYVAAELDALQLTARAASLLAHLRRAEHEGPSRPSAPPWSAYYTGAATIPPMLGEQLRALPFHWLEPPPHGFPYTALRPHVEALRAVYPAAGPVLVVVDFLQLLASPEHTREELRERIGAAAYQCRAIARDCNAVVVALSSTARQGRVFESPLWWVRQDAKGNDRPPPALGDLVGLGKESGDVEFSADSVLTFVRETGAFREGGSPIHVAVAKLRAGRPGWASFTFNGTVFSSAPLPPELLPDDAPGEQRPGVVPAVRPSRGKRKHLDGPDNPNARTEPTDPTDPTE
jgi:replicative DNA helicase